MARTTKQKINFNKFFPNADAFVTLKGEFDPTADNKWDAMDLSLTIQHGLKSAISFNTWLTDSVSTLDQLKAIKEATEKAIKFIEDSKAKHKPKAVIDKDKTIKSMKKKK